MQSITDLLSSQPNFAHTSWICFHVGSFGLMEGTLFVSLICSINLFDVAIISSPSSASILCLTAFAFCLRDSWETFFLLSTEFLFSFCLVSLLDLLFLFGFEHFSSFIAVGTALLLLFTFVLALGAGDLLIILIVEVDGVESNSSSKVDFFRERPIAVGTALLLLFTFVLALGAGDLLIILIVEVDGVESNSSSKVDFFRERPMVLLKGTRDRYDC